MVAVEKRKKKLAKVIFIFISAKNDNLMFFLCDNADISFYENDFVFGMVEIPGT